MCCPFFLLQETKLPTTDQQKELSFSFNTSILFVMMAFSLLVFPMNAGTAMLAWGVIIQARIYLDSESFPIVD